MMTNVGMIDRVLRLAVGLALLAWAGDYIVPLEGWGDTAATFAGGYLAVTGFLRWCPLYAVSGTTTCANDV